jgi:hypothetical protein
VVRGRGSLVRKRFKEGDRVRVWLNSSDSDRDLSRSVGAVYVKKCTLGRGWHQVRVDEPHYVDSMTGMDTDASNPRAFLSYHDSIPTRRIRLEIPAPVTRESRS